MSKFWDRGRKEGMASFLDRGRKEGTELLKDDMLRGRAGGGGPLSATRLGVDSVKKLGMGAFDNIAILARGAFFRNRASDLPTDDIDPAARFEFAQDYYERDEAYILKVQDNKYRSFILMMAIASGILAIDIATWRSYTSSLLLVMGHLAPLVPALVQAFSSAFSNWQVRRRRLDGVLTFIKHPDQWWPEPSINSAINGTGRSVATIVLLSCAIASSAIMGTSPAAMAQAAAPSGTATVNGMFNALPSTDLWGKMLTYIFPGVGPIPGQITPIANGILDGFSAMISVLMALAAAFMSIQLIQGLTETAHSGEVLGRNWHTVWAPLRVCYGFASLAPVVKGACLLQVLALWVAVASGNLGNTIWKSFVDGLSSATITAPNIPETMPLVSRDLQIETCFATLEHEASTGSATAPTWPATYTVGPSTEGSFSQDFAWLTSWWSSNPSVTNPDNVMAVSWNYGPCGQITGSWAVNDSGPLGAMAKEQLAAIDALRKSLRTVAQTIVTSVSPSGSGTTTSTANVFADVTTAKNNFDQALNTANTNFNAASARDNATLTDFQNASKAAGWVSAGSYYMTIARINTSQLDAAKNLPTINTQAFDRDNASGPLRNDLYNPTTGTMTVLSELWSDGMDNPPPALSVQAANAGTMRTSGIYGGLKWMFNVNGPFEQSAMNLVKLGPGGFNGMQEIINTGDYITGIGETLGASALVAPLVMRVGKAVATDGVSELPGLKGSSSGGLLTGTFTFASLFLGSALLAIMGAGIYDSLILPMMPYVHFTFATMGILIIVAEAIVACPLVAFMHIRMDGSEMINQQQRPAYSILFNLLFRIPLTLFGLFFSFQIFNAMVWLLAATLYPAMASVTANSLFGIMGIIIYIVFITGLNYQIANRSFHLITQVPDRVGRWFGASDHGGESNEVHAVAAAIGGSSRSVISTAAQNIKGARAGGRGALEGGGLPAAASGRVARGGGAGGQTRNGGVSGISEPPPPPPPA